MIYLATANRWGEWYVHTHFQTTPTPREIERDYPNAHSWALTESDSMEHARVVAERTAQRGERVYSGVAYMGRALAWRFNPDGKTMRPEDVR